MTGNELLDELKSLPANERAKSVMLIGKIAPESSTRGSAVLDHIERIDEHLILVTEQAFTVKK